MANLAQIYEWFMTGKKPTQAQFRASWASFWNKEETIPQSAISNLASTLNAKTENDQFNAHKVAEDAHADLFLGKEDKNKKGAAGGYVPLNEFTKIANEFLSIVNNLTTGGATSILSAEQGVVLQTQIDAINTLLTSDDINLDTVQELVDAIKTVETSLETILVNDLTTGGTTKALTAEMGKQLKTLIDNISSEISIQNKDGVEQFKVTDLIKFESVSFNAAQKMISIDSLVPLSAFLDPINGNDATGAIENSKKPFKTMEAVVLALPTYNGETYSIYITGGTIPILRKIPIRNFNFIAYKTTTLDFSNCLDSDGITPSIEVMSNLGTNATWNFPSSNIGIVCNYSGVRYFTSGSYGVIILGRLTKLNWLANGTIKLVMGSTFIVDEVRQHTYFNTPVFAATGEVNFTIGNFIIGNRSIAIGGASAVTNIDFKRISESFVNYDPAGVLIKGGKCRVGDVYVTNSVVLGFESVEFYGTISPVTTLDLLGIKVVSGTLVSTTYCKVVAGRAVQNYNNFIGKIAGLTSYGGTCKYIFTNCTIETNGFLLRKGSAMPKNLLEFRGSNTIINTDINTSLVGPVVVAPQWDLDATVTINGSLSTNMLSLGNNITSVYGSATFKEKSKEIVIRSKKDIVNRTLDSNMNYIIDGTISDIIATDRIIIPIGGLSLSGYGFDVSALKATQNNSILFESPVGGCGNLFLSNISLEASGTGSKVFNLTNAGAPTGGADAIELNVVNFDNCTSLGELTNFRQGLWDNIGVFGCKDGLTLSGTWSGGFRSDLVIVRNFGVASSVSTLFKKGTALLMESRFLTDINADFKVGGLLSNFDASTFSSNRLYQIKGAILTRNKVINATENYTDTLNVNSSVCDWFGNIGLPNAGQVAYTDIEVNDPTKGFVLTSPDGTKFRMTVSNAGVTTVTAI